MCKSLQKGWQYIMQSCYKKLILYAHKVAKGKEIYYAILLWKANLACKWGWKANLEHLKVIKDYECLSLRRWRKVQPTSPVDSPPSHPTNISSGRDIYKVSIFHSMSAWTFNA